MIAQLIDKFINARQYKQDKNGNWIPEKEPTLKLVEQGKIGLATSDEKVLFNETGKKIIIDMLEYAVIGSSDNTYPLLQPDGVTGSSVENSLFFTIMGDALRTVPTPTRISNDGSTYFDTLIYDTANNKYKFALKQPIVLPNGGKLSFKVRSTYTTGDSLSYKCAYRVWE